MFPVVDQSAAERRSVGSEFHTDGAAMAKASA